MCARPRHALHPLPGAQDADVLGRHLARRSGPVSGTVKDLSLRPECRALFSLALRHPEPVVTKRRARCDALSLCLPFHLARDEARSARRAKDSPKTPKSPCSGEHAIQLLCIVSPCSAAKPGAVRSPRGTAPCTGQGAAQGRTPGAAQRSRAARSAWRRTTPRARRGAAPRPRIPRGTQACTSPPEASAYEETPFGRKTKRLNHSFSYYP